MVYVVFDNEIVLIYIHVKHKIFPTRSQFQNTHINA
jgi:hypothetical protein